MRTHHLRTPFLIVTALALLLTGGCSSTGQDAANEAHSRDTSRTSAPPERHISHPCPDAETPVAALSTGSTEEIGELRDAYFEAYPAFDEMSFSGAGTQLVNLPEGAWSGVVRFTIPEDSRLDVCTVTAAGKVLRALPTPSSSSVQTLAYGLEGPRFSASHSIDDDITQLLVDSDGQWRFTVSSVRNLPVLHSPVSGDGNLLFWREGDEKDVTLSSPPGHDVSVVQYHNYATPSLEIDTPHSPKRGFTFYTGMTLTSVRASGPWEIE